MTAGLVVVGQVVVVAQSAVSFVDMNNKSATTTAMQKWFFHFISFNAYPS
jgi:hypothetical protein